MEDSSEENLTTRSLLKGILATEPVRPAVKPRPKQSTLESKRLSNTYQDRNVSSPSISLRSKMKDRLRRSVGKSILESETLKKKNENNPKKKPRTEPRPDFEDLNDVTPRTLLKRIIQNENEVSIIVSQRAITASAAAEDNQETSQRASLSGVGNVNLTLPEFQDKEHVAKFKNSRKKRRLNISEFEREVDERLPKNTDNIVTNRTEELTLLGSSSTMARSVESKLEVSAAPQSTYKSGLLRRPNKAYLVSLGDFEQGVEDKYQVLKGSQECFIESIADDVSDGSLNEVANMNTELYAQPMPTDVITVKSHKSSKSSATPYNDREELVEDFAQTPRNMRPETTSSVKRHTSSKSFTSPYNEREELVEDSPQTPSNTRPDITVSRSIKSQKRDKSSATPYNDREELVDDFPQTPSNTGAGAIPASSVKSHERGKSSVSPYNDREELVDELPQTPRNMVTHRNASSSVKSRKSSVSPYNERGGLLEDSPHTPRNIESMKVQPQTRDKSADKRHVLMDAPESDSDESEEDAANLMDGDEYEHNPPGVPESRNSVESDEEIEQSIDAHVLSVSGEEHASDSSSILPSHSSIHREISTSENKKKMNKLPMLMGLTDTPGYIKSARVMREKQPTVTVKKVAKKESVKVKKVGSAFTGNLVKKLFGLHAQMRVSKEALADIEKCLEVYFTRMTADLAAYTAHAGRKTITCADMELLMKRQHLVTDNTSLNVLIERHLSFECRKLLIPCAMSGNMVFPKI